MLRHLPCIVLVLITAGCGIRADDSAPLSSLQAETRTRSIVATEVGELSLPTLSSAMTPPEVTASSEEVLSDTPVPSNLGRAASLTRVNSVMIPLPIDSIILTETVGIAEYTRPSLWVVRAVRIITFTTALTPEEVLTFMDNTIPPTGFPRICIHRLHADTPPPYSLPVRPSNQDCWTPYGPYPEDFTAHRIYRQPASSEPDAPNTDLYIVLTIAESAIEMHVILLHMAEIASEEIRQQFV